MFYISHDSDNFTMIDCCMSDDERAAIVTELRREKHGKGITRLISTHPDDDHIRGLTYLDDQLKLLNFYCVANEATKPDDTDDFDRYCELRNSSKAFHLFAGCTRLWMNQGNEERGSAGIHILWPVTTSAYYRDALKAAADGKSPNNISPIIQYSQQVGMTVLWMGDLETDFMENIGESIDLPAVDILFAPHHGRDSGKVPEQWLHDLSPKIIIIGEAPSTDLNYYAGYDTITQNSAGHITFDCDGSEVHIYVSSSSYSVDFLVNKYKPNTYDYYVGTLEL